MEEDSNKTRDKIKLLINEITKSEHFDDQLMKKIKNICRKNNENITIAHEILCTQLKKNHCIVRINCLLAIDQLYHRSHVFRKLITRDLPIIVQLTLGTDPNHPLPQPVSHQGRLRRDIIRRLKEWNTKFGENNIPLRIAFNYLKDEVDFDDMCLVNDPTRARVRERQERIGRIETKKIEKVNRETKEYEKSLQDHFGQIVNLFNLIKISGTCTLTEEIRDQNIILSRRFLPKVKEWISILSKAGNTTNHNLLRKCVDYKTRIEEILSRFKSFDIDLEITKTEKITTSTEEQNSRKETDTTIFNATLKKLDPTYFFNDSCSSEPSAGPSISSQNPKGRLSDLQEPSMMLKEQVRSRSLVSGNAHGEGEIVTVGITRRVTDIVTQEKPVVRSCGAPLAPGELCRRMDRIKCPLHGIFVDRNRNGAGDMVNEEGTNNQPRQIIENNKKKSKRKSLKGAKEWDETSRSRLEKKICKRSALRRT